MLRWIFLACAVAVSSAYVNDLTEQLGELECIPQNAEPLPEVNQANAMARQLSKYCNSLSEIKSCIKDKIAVGSGNAVVRYFNNTFKGDKMVEKFETLCSKLRGDPQFNPLITDLECLSNVQPASCLPDWKFAIKNTVSGDDLCWKTSNYKWCVRSQLYNSNCTMAVGDFMADYVTGLSGSVDGCGSAVSHPPSTSYMMESLFNFTGSALMHCGETLAQSVEDEIKSKDWDGQNIQVNAIALMEDLMDIFCSKRETVMSCLKEKMPESHSAVDHLILLFIDLDGVDKLFKKYCNNRNVLTDNHQCLSSADTIKVSTECTSSLTNMEKFDFGKMGFATMDYVCSAVVNTTKCLGTKLKQTCNEEFVDFLTEGYLDMLSPYCRNAKPRPAAEIMSPGWSHTVIPGGMVAMECVSKTAQKMIKEFNDTNGPDISSIVQKAMKIVCDDSASILNCLEKNLPSGPSSIDKLTREMLDLNKIRNLVQAKCQVKDEIASKFNCFFQESNQQGGAKCFQPVSDGFMAAIGSQPDGNNKDLDPFFMLVPQKLQKLKEFICAENSAYRQFIDCEATLIKGCSATLSKHMKDVMLGAIRDNCLTYEDKRTDNRPGVGCEEDPDKCSACSLALNSLLWLLIGALTFRWL